jgi:hypothetical protein
MMMNDEGSAQEPEMRYDDPRTEDELRPWINKVEQALQWLTTQEQTRSETSTGQPSPQQVEDLRLEILQKISRDVDREILAPAQAQLAYDRQRLHQEMEGRRAETMAQLQVELASFAKSTTENVQKGMLKAFHEADQGHLGQFRILMEAQVAHQNTKIEGMFLEMKKGVDDTANLANNLAKYIPPQIQEMDQKINLVMEKQVSDLAVTRNVMEKVSSGVVQCQGALASLEDTKRGVAEMGDVMGLAVTSLDNRLRQVEVQQGDPRPSSSGPEKGGTVKRSELWLQMEQFRIDFTNECNRIEGRLDEVSRKLARPTPTTHAPAAPAPIAVPVAPVVVEPPQGGLVFELEPENMVLEKELVRSGPNLLAIPPGLHGGVVPSPASAGGGGHDKGACVASVG